MPLYDLTKDTAAYKLRPTTAVMAKQLNAIAEHNYNLPPKKKAKETIEEFECPNVYAKTIVKYDKKKGREWVNKYYNVGQVDECKDDPEAINRAEGFQLHSRARTIG